MNETKEEILDVLAQILNIVPNQRFGQVLYNYFTHFSLNNDTFNVDDKVALQLLKHELENLKK